MIKTQKRLRFFCWNDNSENRIWRNESLSIYLLNILTRSPLKGSCCLFLCIRSAQPKITFVDLLSVWCFYWMNEVSILFFFLLTEKDSNFLKDFSLILTWKKFELKSDEALIYHFKKISSFCSSNIVKFSRVTFFWRKINDRRIHWKGNFRSTECKFKET